MQHRTFSHAQALGILQGAVYAAGGNPEPAVWEQAAKALAATRDPIGMARQIVEQMTTKGEGERLWNLFTSIANQENDR